MCVLYGYGDIGYAKECEVLYDEEGWARMPFAATGILVGGENISACCLADIGVSGLPCCEDSVRERVVYINHPFFRLLKPSTNLAETARV